MQTNDLVLDALGEASRRRIVDELRAGPATVGVLADRLPVSRPAVSQHLKVLHTAGLVRYEQRGTRNVYRLEPTGFHVLGEWLEEFWSTVLDGFVRHATEVAAEEHE